MAQIMTTTGFWFDIIQTQTPDGEATSIYQHVYSDTIDFSLEELVDVTVPANKTHYNGVWEEAKMKGDLTSGMNWL